MTTASDVPHDPQEAATGEYPPPPVDSAEQVLPFDALAWEKFEDLCHRLASLDGDVEHSQRFGTRGQSQSGIDIYARKHDGTYVAYQCKRLAELGPADIKNAVTTFLDGDWARKASRFVFCTSHSLRPTQLADEHENQAKRLRNRQPSIAFEAWDVDALSLTLKALPDLVREFFGQPWLERFLPDQRTEEPSEESRTFESLTTGFLTYPRVRVVVLDWAPQRLQRELKQLEEDDAPLFGLLTDRLGMPPGPQLLAGTILQPPPWAQDADARVWELLARIAESFGDWQAAVTAWENTAARHENRARVRDLMAAAAAAEVGDDETHANELVEQARALDPRHARVLLNDIPQDAPPTDQLKALEALQPDNSDDRLLIEGRMSLASLRLPNAEKARLHLKVVEEIGAGTVIAQAVSVNITVQEGRLALLRGHPLNSHALRAANQGALELRGRLLRERRWDEASRLLMLAADALSLLGERRAASDLLAQATGAELSTPNGPTVLADSAVSRALDGRLALDLLKTAQDSPAVRRIRAEAHEMVGTSAERTEALKQLEVLVVEDGDEAAEAAFIRLAATIGSQRTEWSTQAAEYLRAHGYERQAVSTEAFYRARWHADYEGAEALLAPYMDTGWARVMRLRLALSRGNRSVLRAAAADVLSAGPAQVHRVDAGRAFAMADDFQRAKEVLIGVARDASAPPLARADAYSLLVRVTGSQLEDWVLTADLHEEWVTLCP